jgi:hypothetical protein
LKATNTEIREKAIDTYHMVILGIRPYAKNIGPDKFAVTAQGQVRNATLSEVNYPVLNDWASSV